MHVERIGEGSFNMKETKKTLGPRRKKLHDIIFEAETPAGKTFDIILLIFIIVSILIVNIESVPSITNKYHDILIVIEWVVTIFFTIEYILRIYVSKKPWRYITSFYGIIDFLSTIPTYISFFIIGSHSLIVIRALRLLRVFRVFKMVNFMNQGSYILIALRRSRSKIAVFLFFIFVTVNIIGSLMYLIEGGVNSEFDSIPRSIYWTIVTLTTVGYGDISPITPFGQAIAASVMLIGYSIIAVPTGIVTGELASISKRKQDISTQVCMNCSKEGHDANAEFCKFCGSELDF